MSAFLEYWTAADYILLFALVAAAVLCLIMALRAEKKLMRDEKRETLMCPNELREHNTMMQRALKRWHQIEHEVHTCSLYLEWQARGKE